MQKKREREKERRLPNLASPKMGSPLGLDYSSQDATRAVILIHIFIDPSYSIEIPPYMIAATP